MLLSFIVACVSSLGAAMAEPVEPQAADSTAVVSFQVMRIAESADTVPLSRAVVRSGLVAAQTDSAGTAILKLQLGVREIVVSRLGFSPATVQVMVAGDTTIVVVLAEVSEELESVVVSATRGERRIEDEPLRVEVLSGEEVEEKLLMTPGDITMMLNETSGLRVQTTSPSLGGAAVRIQGLRGRYTQILSDGLPLYGGQTGSLGLLQIPPMDLGGVEIIKGVASALYGGSALGGVINLLSRRPGESPVREILANGTTLGGTDLVGFDSRQLSDAFGYSLLAGVHRQSGKDRDDDGWADIPAYRRFVVRPRGFWASTSGSNVTVTAGTTQEEREGGTLEGAAAPDGNPYPENLRTSRWDAGAVGRLIIPSGIVSARGSVALQNHRHIFGPVLERDEHLTWFAEAAYTLARETQTLVLGAALQQETYRNRSLSQFDYAHSTPSAFAQLTRDMNDRFSITASGRLDHHSEYGAIFSPRVSGLVRLLEDWTIRASGGTGYFAPTPFTEATEVSGLTSLEPLRALRVERATSGSLDVGGSAGQIELNGTVFGSTIRHPVAELDESSPVPGRASAIRLINSAEPTRTVGAEALLRWRREPVSVTATYTFVRSTELNVNTSRRGRSPLVPAHQLGLVTMIEEEGTSRLGLEIYHTGSQSLDENPYRGKSRPHTHIGVLAERRFGRARVFVNAENLLDVRQTKHDPLVMPVRGRGGRWTTDVWAPLDGRVANVGVRLDLSPSDTGRSP